jgi:hypothetical protein
MQYRSERLMELNNSYVIREQPHQELNMTSYSEYDVINFQCDIAFNPPKSSPADSRIVSGLVRQKDKTLVSVIQDMNFLPQVLPFDKSDRELVEYAQVFTAKIKKVLIQTNFRDKMENIARLLVSRGNVFVDVRKQEKWNVKKVNIGGKNEKLKWKTIYEKVCDYADINIIPNTAVFPMNIRGETKKDQTRTYTVRHYPVAQIAQIFKNNPRWEWVPKTPSMTIPTITNGIWGDYYLKLPVEGYVEVIEMQSEMFNEYMVWVNGVQMLPVQQEEGVITGYPLSEISPMGDYTLCKGDYDRIPFFYFSKSNPDANFVKEEELNEVMRLMVLMLRQKTQPSIGNNTDRVLSSNIWDPNTIISDITKDDISILKPNEGIGAGEFSFYKLLTESIAESSVSSSVEGTNTEKITATQYIDQKKENLKKIGLSLDRVVDLLRQIYWRILDNEISYIDQKVKSYDSEGKFIEAYQSFIVEDSIDGRTGDIEVNLQDDFSDVNLYEKATEEAKNKKRLKRTIYAKPKDIKNVYKKLRDKIYINVVASPEGEQMNLLAMLFNLLTQYVNLKGGDSRKINFDYLETIIADNSGFDPNKVFLDQSQESMNTMMNPNAQGKNFKEENPKEMVPQNMSANKLPTS